MNPYGVVNIRFDCYKSIPSTVLQYIEYLYETNLQYDFAYVTIRLWLDIDDIPSHQEWIIGAGVNSRLLGDWK